MRRTRPFDRAGFSTRAVIVVLALLTASGLVAWLMAKQVDWAPSTKGPLLHTVKRGEFLHEINERGEVESASNVEIRCEVQSRGMGGITILELIPEGTYVQPGDKLVVLDKSALENERKQQEITCSNSEAAVLTAENDLAAAEIAKSEYLQGLYILNENLIQNKKFVAEEAERQALQNLKYSEGLAKKGYVTELRVETDRIAVAKAKLDRESADLELRVLREFTKDKTVKQFDSSISIVQARLNSAKATHKIDTDQLALIQSQVDKCTILAPAAGQVVYANEFRRHGGQDIVIEEGTMVRERQSIIRLPDPKRMQVTAKINEAKITMVREGMPATIRLDAFPDREFEGVVERVNEYPAPTSFWAANVKEYETFVKILGSLDDLKPGLTAEVRIQVEEQHDVLLVPVQTVFEHGEHHYCILPEGKGFRAQEVQIGSTNEKFVILREGLREDDQIVLAAFDYRDKVNLPKLPDKKPSRAKTAPAAAPDAVPVGEKPTAVAEQKTPGVMAPAEDPFKKLDQNGDGKIEKSEAPGAMQQYFSTVDKNSDGAITRDEWNAVKDIMRQRPGGPGGPGAPPQGARP
ncbi:MAG TPA: efflux RND transporter periplasmic adaptor subunit [Thermoguttaceae bacterium]|nr:efflux RND transporter periplasmic adaptor subunit [Thermoguttaceae bacterium]